MKRCIRTLLTAVLLAGVGTVHAQIVEYDAANNNYVSAHTGFLAKPTSWTGVDSTPTNNVVDPFPSFSYAGVAADSSTLKQARMNSNDRFQMQELAVDFHVMVAFDFPTTNVSKLTMQNSTFGPGAGGSETYLILHDASQSYSNGWYATLIESNTAAGQWTVEVNVQDVTWHEFTPSTVDGAVPLGTIGAPVDISTLINASFDEAGYYADVYGNGASANHNHYLWYFAVEAGGPLLLDPDEVAMEFFDAASVVSNSIAVSYRGSLPTNVTVSSASVVNASHPGGFTVSPASFTLNSPYPSNQNVVVSFDNNTALLAANETATGIVEFVWNEVGSATSSTSTVPVSATHLAVSEENTIAIFQHNSLAPGLRTADISFTGVDATISDGIAWGASNAGSTDGTYGTLKGNANTDARAAAINNDVVVTVSVTNHTGNVLVLDSLNFDASALWGGDTIDVSLSGDLGDTNLLTYAGLIPTQTGDWDDFDIDLTTLPGNTLADGESASFAFVFSNGTGASGLDNIAIVGSGIVPATLARTPREAGWVSLGVSGLDTMVSQSVGLIVTAGDLNTNVVITGVTVSNTTHPGAMSATGTFPLVLSPPDTTNSSAFSLEFDNTVANLAAGEYAEALVQVEWNEGGSGSRSFDFYAYGTRPADSPSNTIIALWDTEFLTPDAAYNGVLGAFTGAVFDGSDKGSLDNTYGSLLTSRSAGTNETWTWRMNGNDPVASLTITNTTVASIELTTLHFDMGRWYADGATDFTLSISGDVTENTNLLTSGTTELGWQGHDYDDHDIVLTNLTDHTIEAGESVTITWTLHAQGNPDIGVFIDNIALVGDFDAFGGWADSEGLTSGVNDGPDDNPDGDSKDNLMEYATGGNPLVPDGGAGGTWPAEEGGTNWVYYVHQERQDDPSLAYSVTARDDLVAPPDWSAGGVEWVGESAGPGLFKSVTHRTDAGSVEFIRLGVEQN